MTDYRQKYLKYKAKYMMMRKLVQRGGNTEQIDEIIRIVSKYAPIIESQYELLNGNLMYLNKLTNEQRRNLLTQIFNDGTIIYDFPTTIGGLHEITMAIFCIFPLNLVDSQRYITRRLEGDTYTATTANINLQEYIARLTHVYHDKIEYIFSVSNHAIQKVLDTHLSLSCLKPPINILFF